MQTVTLRSKTQLTPDTYHLVLDRPEGYAFTPGQATDLALDREGWRDETRPFTYTSLPDEDTLSFVIKSYPDHDGVTEQIGQMSEGEDMLIGTPRGAIQDQGTGVFVCGGSGVTPFIPILRARLKREGTLVGCTLVFSNKTTEDIILRDVFEAMNGLTCHWTVTDEDGPLARGKVDRDMLEPIVRPGHDTCYVCGPKGMTDDVTQIFGDLGVSRDRIVRHAW